MFFLLTILLGFIVGLRVVVLLKILAIHSLSLNWDSELVFLFLSTFSIPLVFLSLMILSLDSTSSGSIVRLVDVGSTATYTGNLLIFSLDWYFVFILSTGLVVVVRVLSDGGVVIVNSSGKGVKGLKENFDKKFSTECF